MRVRLARRYWLYIILIVIVLNCIVLFYIKNVRQKQRFIPTGAASEYLGKAKKCYRLFESNSNLEPLEDILKSPPKPDNTIFFHDTSCLPNSGTVSFNARQACAIESAAKWNPNRDIFILFASKVAFPKSDSIREPIVEALKSYPNVHFRTVDWYEYARNTLAEEWVHQDIILTSRFHVSHLSDFIRFITLYKYGGMHIDLDFVIQQSLDTLPSNFAGAERVDSVNCAVLGVKSNGVGHKIIEMLLRENIEHYDPSDWAYSGPGAITRTMQNICNRNDTTDMRPELCWNFEVFPIQTFFPIATYDNLFATDIEIVNETMNQIKDSVAVHFWNSASEGIEITKSSPDNVYTILAKRNCPKSWEASGNTF